MYYQVYPDFLPDELFAALNQEIDKRGWHHGWKSRASVNGDTPYSHWNIDFSNTSAENGLDAIDNIPELLRNAWEHISEKYVPGARLVRCYANGHTYGVEGYPHTDTKRAGDKTILVYMNPNWKRDWGGETVFYDGDQVLYAELPKRNKAIIFDGSIVHVAKGVTRVCPTLRTTLMFKITMPDGIDTERDNIQKFLSSVNADTQQHSANTLTGHLLRTYDLLKSIGQRQEVCNAGAVHSVFGTNIFKWQDKLSYADVPKVAEVAGPYAARLAEIFSKLPRPGVLEMNIDDFHGSLSTLEGTAIPVSIQEFNDLCVLEAANLHDQQGLKHYPKLAQLWKTLNTR